MIMKVNSALTLFSANRSCTNTVTAHVNYLHVDLQSVEH